LQDAGNCKANAARKPQARYDGQPIELRQAINDARGEISELLGKAINRGAPLSSLAKFSFVISNIRFPPRERAAWRDTSMARATTRVSRL